MILIVNLLLPFSLFITWLLCRFCPVDCHRFSSLSLLLPGGGIRWNCPCSSFPCHCPPDYSHLVRNCNIFDEFYKQKAQSYSAFLENYARPSHERLFWLLMNRRVGTKYANPKSCHCCCSVAHVIRRPSKIP